MIKVLRLVFKTKLGTFHTHLGTFSNLAIMSSKPISQYKYHLHAQYLYNNCLKWQKEACVGYIIEGPTDSIVCVQESQITKMSFVKVTR